MRGRKYTSVKPGIPDRPRGTRPLTAPEARGTQSRGTRHASGRVILALARPCVIIFAFAVLMLPCSRLAAALRAGADLLNMGVGARPAAMGSAYTAAASGVESIFWNPAGLSAMTRREFGAMHSQWLLDSSLDSIGVGLPLSAGALGLGIVRLSHGGITARAEDRSEAGTFEASDQVLSAAYGTAFGMFALGAGIKFLRSSIGADSASTMAVDLGINRRLWNLPLSAGLAVQNMGPGLRYISQTDPLPLSVSAGLAAEALPGLLMVLDVKRLVNDRQTSLSFGTEYRVMPALAVRGGYSPISTGMQNPAGPGLGAGFGLTVMGTRFDYAMTPFGDLGNVHRLSMNCRF
ncbi:MAG: PorV/PorQ family protein [bacterium]